MAQEKAHRVMDHRIIDQMVIINDEIQRALPVGKFNKQLRKKRGRLAYWRFAPSLHWPRSGAPVTC
ncbi:hypothetical protein MJ579_26695 [Klebsiella pneumoniae]|nr:hypothetical protein MJ579_26695 [Klebsiella pneumoniae]